MSMVHVFQQNIKVLRKPLTRLSCFFINRTIFFKYSQLIGTNDIQNIYVIRRTISIFGAKIVDFWKKMIYHVWWHYLCFLLLFVVKTSWNVVQIFIVVCILILCCFHIDQKSNMATMAAILIFPKKFVTTTPPEPQGVFTKRFSLAWRLSRFKFKDLRFSEWRLWRHT